MENNKPMLVIEDSKPIAKVIKHVAQKAGFQVKIAETFAQCQEILQQGHQFEVASIDYNLPDASKGEAIDLVLTYKIPSIVLTGQIDIKTREQILNRPVIDYIPKESGQTYHYLGKLLTRLELNKQIRVLVVDDSKSARKYICKLLERHNFLISEAEDGQQGLAVLAEYPDIRLVITDHEMPIMNGIRFVSEVRKFYAKDQLAIIGLSGDNAGSLSSRFIQNGANDFLPKSFCYEDFYCRVMQNIENIEYVNKIKYLANTDYLTGLVNRQYFFEQVPKLKMQARQQSLIYSVVMIDIDHFKSINDTYGHDVGDKVIQALSATLLTYFPTDILPQQVASRFGGEEFCLFLQAEDPKIILEQLENLRKEIHEQNLPYLQHQIQYTISIGLTFQDDDLESMITQADKALYQSKQSGRNRITLAAVS
ncbi:diguanylate cyclase [Catenovulum sp. 2E275]|uniref:diguanylate cyclase n=1 Tax=Catenovulum sp. 2E275 TaxID=2980497 RepID=UPI0021CE0CF9|nr:diguanylate cyclase [Catenovulum sp. 2E275]MCU4677191.1 diguanylate cyclase [Catenovulum sp. 2E275]